MMMKEINQRRMRYFYEVFMAGSIRAAADKLNTDMSVVTRQIRLLEQELNTPLFERRARRGMTPTAEAETVLEYYRKVCAHQERLEADLQKVRNRQNNKVHIAVLAAYINVIVDIVKDFGATHSGVEICVEEISTSSQIVAKVLEGIAHIGIIHNYPIDDRNIRCYVSAPLPICLLVRKDSPLATNKKVTFLEIANYPIVLPDTSSSLRHMVQTIERSEKIQLKLAFVSNSISALKKFALSGCGGALMSTFAARQEIDEGQLVALEIDYPAFMSSHSYLIARRDRTLAPAVNQLLRIFTAKLPLFAHPAVTTI